MTDRAEPQRVAHVHARSGQSEDGPHSPDPAAISSRVGRVRRGVSSTPKPHHQAPAAGGDIMVEPAALIADAFAPDLPTGASQEARYAPTMGMTLDRLIREVTDAVDDGDGAVAEVARLYTWLHAEFLPWTLSIERDYPQADPVAVAAVRANRAQLADLAAELRGVHGMEGALLSHDVQVRSTLLFAHLQDLWAETDE